MVRNGLVPSLLLFGVLPSFPASSNSNKSQFWRIIVLQIARDETETIVFQAIIRTELETKIPPATRYLIRTWDQVQVRKGNRRKWDDPLTVKRIADKSMTQTESRSNHSISHTFCKWLLKVMTPIRKKIWTKWKLINILHALSSYRNSQLKYHRIRILDIHWRLVYMWLNWKSVDYWNARHSHMFIKVTCQATQTMKGKIYIGY